MSQGDLEIVRSWYRAFNDEVAFRELTHPEIEWYPIEENHTIHRGLDAAMRVVEGWTSAWAEYGGAIEEIIDAGDEGIVLVFRATARGVASGAEVGFRQYPHFRTHEGKVIYLYEYGDRDEALKAVGLEE